MSKNPIFILLILTLLLFTVTPKSQDYARHIELSLLFYECQRSGKLPEKNRIYWRHDSMLEAGADVGVDLTGGYYDAGDNVKFNFPMASSFTLLSWSAIEFGDGYKKAGQWDYLLEAIKWATDYFLKCWTGSALYVGVGSGSTDHGHWCPPEYIDYPYPSYKISSGTEVACETSAALVSASILFKDIDSSYSSKLLKAGRETYDYGDKNRGDYTQAAGFYTSYSGYRDELAWGALWLYRATGEEEYHDKFKAIADAKYDEQDTKKYLGCPGPISWDDKRPGAYVLEAQLTGDENRTQVAYDYCDMIIDSPRTPGGLYYDNNLSQWASNRYAANAAVILAFFANILPESDPKRKTYIEFVKSQTDYILGDNPANINYVVGAEDNSPKAVHHRGASGTFDAGAKPTFNIFTLYGALAGGPGKDDSYSDTRSNYQMNEVALDYNAGFTCNLAALLHYGYGVKDSGSILDFDRAWPQRPPTPDINIEFDGGDLKISTGSGMLCSSWCISFKSNIKVGGIYDCTVLESDPPNYKFCNKRETNFLDGAGTPQNIHIVTSWKDEDGNENIPNEFEVMCNGFHHTGQLVPEYGQLYKVTGKGGKENTKPMFEVTKCWPSWIC